MAPQRPCECGCGTVVARRFARGHQRGWKLSRPHKPVTISNGYRYVYAPDHPAANHVGRVREHRLVVEARIGRYLTDEEVVHHRNGVRSDNRDENLELLLDGDHRRLHMLKHSSCSCGQPHHAQGLCRSCYMKAWRDARRAA